MSSDLKQIQSFDARYRQLDTNRAESVVERIRCEKIYDDAVEEFEIMRWKWWKSRKTLNEPEPYENTDIQYEQYCARVDIEYNCKKMFNTVFHFTNKNCKVKHISNAKSKLLTNEICGICLDKHPVKDLIVTNCNHVMGKICFEDVCRSIHIGNEITPCPLCRQNVTQVCVYRRK